MDISEIFEGNIHYMTPETLLPKSKKTLMVGDGENVHYGAKNLNLRLNVNSFAEKISASGSTAFIVSTRNVFSKKEVQTFRDKGIQFIEREPIYECYRHSNSDNTLIALTSSAISTGDYEHLCIMSGDGELVLGLAQGVKLIDSKVIVSSLSWPSSTSRSIVEHPLLDGGNFEIGMDCTY